MKGNTDSNFPNRLRKLIEENTSQVELAKQMGVTRQAISSYSLGRTTPDIEKFQKMADYFGVSYDYLLGKQTKSNDYISKLELENAILREKLKKIKDII